MPFIGSIIPANVARIDPKAKEVRRKREEEAREAERGEFARKLDQAELSSVEEVEEVERTQGVPEPHTEMSREDREKHGYYQPGGTVPPPEAPPHIDLAG